MHCAERGTIFVDKKVKCRGFSFFKFNSCHIILIVYLICYIDFLNDSDNCADIYSFLLNRINCMSYMIIKTFYKYHCLNIYNNQIATVYISDILYYFEYLKCVLSLLLVNVLMTMRQL